MTPLPPHLVLRLDLPVAWGEQDQFGHVNNVVYFRYFENVRMHYLARIGVLSSHGENGIGVILAHTECSFKKPVQWPQTLSIYTGVPHLGNTSFTLEYTLLDGSGDVVATGTSIQVMYDYRTGAKTPVSETVRAAIKKLQAGPAINV